MQISRDLEVKLKRFKSDRRAWTSFTILAVLFLITLPAELLCNVRPIVMTVDGKWYFPIFFTYSWEDFGGRGPAEPDYKSQMFQDLFKGTPAAPPAAATASQPASSSSVSMDDFEEEGESGLGLDLNDFEEESSPAGNTGTGLNLGLDDFEDSTEPIAGESSGLNLDLGDFEDAEAPQTLVIELSDFDEDAEVTPVPQTQAAPLETVRPARDVWMLWPPIRYDYKYIPSQSKTGQIALASPSETFLPHLDRKIPSSWEDGHYLGTDDRGRDVLARLVYGFRISMVFGLSLAVTGTILGCLLGGIQGYFGGWVDLIGQRLTEIWGSMPRLYILIILSALLTPSALLLFLILNLTAWMGIAAYIRAEFLKGRNLEYVKAARALGVSDFTIMRKHILPNSLTPVITFFPFEVTAGILALVSLDFLNLGVPSPAPSMGELLAQGKTNLQATWILLPTFAVLTTTLTLLTFVGDGVRNAFDPRKSVT